MEYKLEVNETYKLTRGVLQIYKSVEICENWTREQEGSERDMRQSYHREEERSEDREEGKKEEVEWRGDRK